ncbi:MAG: omptin family outer membrane protease [Treponema sp.]|jgi:outer membrane protease|nr:omptin family outer membrane protease [Treponema sp.]
MRKKMRRVCLLLPVFLSASWLPAESPFSGSLSLFSGVFFGQMYEELYEKDTLVSQLEWDENIVPMVGYEGKFSFHDFFIGTELLSAIPVESGVMRDTDWINAGHMVAPCRFGDWTHHKRPVVHRFAR